MNPESVFIKSLGVRWTEQQLDIEPSAAIYSTGIFQDPSRFSPNAKVSTMRRETGKVAEGFRKADRKYTVGLISPRSGLRLFPVFRP
jgi:hypothetical protein